MRVPDAASVATAHWLEGVVRPQSGRLHRHQCVGRAAAGETDARRRPQQGSIVTLLCDSGERYLDTYYNPEWVSNNIGDLQPYLAQLADL